MQMRILLVNPPIYDFTAYDFWLKAYGLLTVGGYLRGRAEVSFFDFLDRRHRLVPKGQRLREDGWGRGEFICEIVAKPACFSHIPRYYRRFGLARSVFQEFLSAKGPFDFALVQTGMTYWYPGVREAVDEIRRLSPGTKVVFGGVYATLCPDHAEKLGAELVVKGSELEALWALLGVEPDLEQLPLWEAYENLQVGVLKLSDGCPFSCTYCAADRFHAHFAGRPLERSLAELEFLCRQGAGDIAFYDDALLFHSDKILVPFLNEVVRRGVRVNFHTPNALHARFITKALAELMVQGGFKTFYLGFESLSDKWQGQTGSKVCSGELAEAVKNLFAAGAKPEQITAYQIIGHPKADLQEVEASMKFVNSLGIRLMLSDFSPVPETADGEECRRYVDMDEPLLHNKTAFPIVLLGVNEVNRLKGLCRQLNSRATCGFKRS